MTNDLERTFFDTFGIEPHYYCGNDYVFEAMLEYECTEGNREKCKTCKKVGKSYPQITDRILLGLICINEDEQPNIEWLKQCILENLIHRFEKNLFCDKEQAVKQVRTLFKETK